MLISTRGRYALRLMVDLAEHNTGDFIPLQEIAERQEISEKYLERIITVLVQNKMILGHRGKGGGYKLNKTPAEYSVGSILELTEESLAPVACLAKDAAVCEKAKNCKTLPMWEKLNTLIDGFLAKVTIADLL